MKLGQCSTTGLKPRASSLKPAAPCSRFTRRRYGLVIWLVLHERIITFIFSPRNYSIRDPLPTVQRVCICGAESSRGTAHLLNCKLAGSLGSCNLCYCSSAWWQRGLQVYRFARRYSSGNMPFVVATKCPLPNLPATPHCIVADVRTAKATALLPPHF